MKTPKTTIIALLGTEKDKAENKWRPNTQLSCLQQKQSNNDPLLPFHVDKVLLIYNENGHRKLAKEVKDKIFENKINENATIKVDLIQIKREDPWDFEKVFSAYYQFFTQKFHQENNTQYYLHINTGTHVDQITFFLLAERHFIQNAKILQTIPPTNEYLGTRCSITDLNLEKYQTLLSHFSKTKQGNREILKRGIKTKNEKYNALIKEIEFVASNSSIPILLGGPTGAGKTELAKAICSVKGIDIKSKFIPVNCATLSGDLANSALFGHTAGAFTGAVTDHQGFLKKAEDGLLFLDEIGELPLDTQAMLLKAIEEQEFYPLGGGKVKSDFQLICGTNKDLQVEVEAKRFRKDLLCRINTWTFKLPGLAERREDIEPNIEYELNENKKTFGNITFTNEARQKFLTFALAPTTPWEGNFRDLRAAIQRMSTFAKKDGKITEQIVEKEIDRLKASWQKASSQKPQDALLAALLGEDYQTKYNLPDLAMLKCAIPICRASKNAAEAGRKLFAKSLADSKKPNPSDLTRKLLNRFGLKFDQIHNIDIAELSDHDA